MKNRSTQIGDAVDSDSSNFNAMKLYLVYLYLPSNAHIAGHTRELIIVYRFHVQWKIM